jgi:phosphonate transport system substrate-binding protein
MMRRPLLAAPLLALLLLWGCDQQPSVTSAHPNELTFSILSAESQTSMQPLWQPLLDDLSKQAGVKVKPYFATNYTALVEAMRFGQVQMGWFSARPALEAVNRADAEVLGRVVDQGGEATYKSVVIVRKGSGITLDKLMACERKYAFGVGDAQSTSGTLAPLTYLFTPKGIEPTRCFKTVRSANHQANFFAVANGVLDAATNNTVGMFFYRRENPQLADKVEVIWTSPPLPESSILVRKDLDPALKEKIRQFFLTYGTGSGAEGDRQRAVLQRLAYGGFRPADDSYLDPVREMVAGEALSEARKSGDKARIAKAEADFQRVQGAAAQRRAANPDI